MLAIRSLVFTSFLFVTALLGGLIVLVTFWAPDRWHWWVTLSWCRLSVWAGEFFCNMNVVVEGTENIPDEPSVLMIKHTTALETYWQVTAFPQATWVIKREILWIPLFGWAVALLLDPIAINRSSGRRAVKQVIQKGKAKLKEGIWVTVFPEGTRMPPGETRKYGISGAALAEAAGARIVPVAHNAGDLWQRRGFIKRPGTVRFVIGPPIDASTQSPKETNLLVQDWIETTMHEISTVYRSRHAEGNKQ
jgi:1-acyl-sn-glycerol-3-phosphate acyltransferase